MSDNLYVGSHKGTNSNWRKGYDMTFGSGILPGCRKSDKGDVDTHIEPSDERKGGASPFSFECPILTIHIYI